MRYKITTSMETAATISDESYTSGYICCPGAEQWFKFVATRTGQYTICTTGNLDTIGTLYDCGGNQITRVDDYAPCGKINFRIICNLTEGNTYIAESVALKNRNSYISCNCSTKPRNSFTSHSQEAYA